MHYVSSLSESEVTAMTKLVVLVWIDYVKRWWHFWLWVMREVLCQEVIHSTL